MKKKIIILIAIVAIVAVSAVVTYLFPKEYLNIWPTALVVTAFSGFGFWMWDTTNREKAEWYYNQLKDEFDEKNAWVICSENLLDRVAETSGFSWTTIEGPEEQTILIYCYGLYQIKCTVRAKTVQGDVMLEKDGNMAKFSQGVRWFLNEISLLSDGKIIDSKLVSV